MNASEQVVRGISPSKQEEQDDLQEIVEDLNDSIAFIISSLIPRNITRRRVHKG